MKQKILSALSRGIDTLSTYFAARKGLLPMIGILLVMVNFILTIAFPGALSETNVFLHLGIIVAILGIMLAWAL